MPEPGEPALCFSLLSEVKRFAFNANTAVCLPWSKESLRIKLIKFQYP